jgi:hypothetical protein
MEKIHIREIDTKTLMQLSKPMLIVYHSNKLPVAVLLPLPTPENIERLVEQLREMAEGGK